MEKPIETIVEEYRGRQLTRRDFFARLIPVTGSSAAAQLSLERTGLAATLVSEIESAQANVDSATVDYLNGAVKLSGYLSQPKAKGKYPAILVIHENRGLNEHIRDVTRRVARAGYIALGIDLLSRLGGTAQFTIRRALRHRSSGRQREVQAS